MFSRASKKEVWVVALCALCFRCGQQQTPPAPSPARELVAQILIPEGLKVSRLVSAGCIQVVRTGEVERAEFSHENCPAEGVAEASTVVFSLGAKVGPEGTLLYFYQDAIRVGEANDPKKSGNVLSWSLRHLCQVSDPTVATQREYAELCELSFGNEINSQNGRFLAVKMTALDELARRKITQEDVLREQALKARTVAAQLEISQESLRRDMERAQNDQEEAANALVEARQGLRDATASSLSVHRGLERTKAQAELEYALKERKYLTACIRFAKSEQKRAAELKRQIEESDRAKAREVEIKKLMEPYKGFKDSIELKQWSAIYDQNHQNILSDIDRRKLEEDATFASAEAEKLERLEKEEAAAALHIIKTKDDLARLDRIPPSTDESVIEESKDPK